MQTPSENKSGSSEKAWQDLWSAALFFAIGLAACLIALGYPLGTMRRVGPGMFPVIVSVGLMLIGVGLAIQTLLAQKAPGRPRVTLDFGLFRTLMLVAAGLGAFALLIRPAGLFISVVITALVVSFADPEQTWKRAFVLAFSLAGICSLIFVVGIGIPIQVWP